MSPTQSSIVGLAVRGYRCNGLQQVDLFWCGPQADGFDVYRDGEWIATVSAIGYTDRIGRLGSGSYRYGVGVTGTRIRTNEAVVTFRGAASRVAALRDGGGRSTTSTGSALATSAATDASTWPKRSPSPHHVDDRPRLDSSSKTTATGVQQ